MSKRSLKFIWSISLVLAAQFSTFARAASSCANLSGNYSCTGAAFYQKVRIEQNGCLDNFHFTFFASQYPGGSLDLLVDENGGPLQNCSTRETCNGVFSSGNQIISVRHTAVRRDFTERFWRSGNNGLVIAHDSSRSHFEVTCSLDAP